MKEPEADATLTGFALQAAARRLHMTQEDVAKAAGVSSRTVHRVFNTDGPVRSVRQSTLDQIARVLGLGDPIGSSANALLVVVDIPPDRLVRSRERLPLLFALYELAMKTRCKAELLDALNAIDPTRVTSVELRDDDLYVESMGGGIRWGGDRVKGARVLDIGDAGVSRAAVERYWKALMLDEPVLQYIRTTVGMEFMVLSVPTDRDTRPGVVSASALGRQFL